MPAPKLIDLLEKKVNDAGDRLDETIKSTTDYVKERVSAMSARVETYLEDEEKEERQRRRDSRNNLTAVKG